MTTATPALTLTPLQAALQLQREAYLMQPTVSLAQRQADLRALLGFLRENKQAICDAISADYGYRSPHESMLTDVAPSMECLAHTIKALPDWMRPQYRKVDWTRFPGARNRLIAQPLGVVGVIVPWNFPINLSFCPLASILAAGNRAMVKMSENSRHLAALLIREMPKWLPPEKLQFFDETGSVGIEFSSLPFDHLCFTGSGDVGRKVMASAAANLCPVTLELGGKAPAIIDEDFPMQTAAERILFAKCLNAGQICLTVDHLWLPEFRLNEFVELAQRIVQKRYAGLHSPDYTSINNAPAFKRLLNAMDEARARGATLVPLFDGPEIDHASRKIAPHLVLYAPLDCELMQREIFGPLLPVQTYTHLSNVIGHINRGPHPLAIYPFSHHAKWVNQIIDNTLSGGVCVNDAIYHNLQQDMPFGGVGASGMGHYHARDGFEAFSKMRPVFQQAAFSALKFIVPPYGRWVNSVINYVTK